MPFSTQAFFCASGRRRGGWVSGAVWRTDPGHVPTEPSQQHMPFSAQAFFCASGRRRGGWVSEAVWRTDPGHVPTEPSQQHMPFSAQALFCASGRRRGGWVSGAMWRTDPGHVPTEPSQQHMPFSAQAFFCASDRRRGGWVSGAVWRTDPGHVPTEPSQQHMPFSAQALFCASGRRRGGWVSGAMWRTDPGHVPTEPPHDFDFWRQHLCRCSWCKQAVHFAQDGTFDCMDFSSRSSKLTVSVRQPVGLWKLCNQLGSLLYGCEHVDFFFGVMMWVLSGSFVHALVVIPPCLHGGPLSTPRDQFADMLRSAIWAAYHSESLAWVFLTDTFSDAISRHSSLAFCWQSGDYVSCFAYTGAIGLRLAGPFKVLHRQILLPDTLTFSISVSLEPLADISLRDDVFADGESACTCQEVGFDSCQSVHDDIVSACDNSLKSAWVHQLRHMLQTFLDTYASCVVQILQVLLVEFGTYLTAMCRTGCMLSLCYLFRLLLFGWQLKGGTCNCDNLLLVARSATAAVPWGFGIGLIGFSPRLQSSVATQNRRSRRCSRYSIDLFLLILLIATLVSPVNAAHSRCPSAHPTAFPAAPVHQNDDFQDGGLLQDRDVAEDLFPDPGVVGPPPAIYITRAYKVFGFGHQPEYVSSATASTATFQRCLELLEPELGVGRTGGTGALYPLRGPAVLDELQAQWIPDWVHNALGRLVIIDASLLGYTPFQVYVPDGIISYQRVNRIVPVLENQEYYIFIPSQDGDPLAFEGYSSRMIVDHGDVVHLTPDPATPQSVQDAQWAFEYFSDWSLTEFADGYDEPVGEQHVMVLSDRESFLIVAIEGESDVLLTHRICAELRISNSGASVVRPSVPFERPMYYQYHLADVVFLLETPLVGSELVVFVDSRPVLQTFSAVRLQQPRVLVDEAIAQFKIQVEAIEGYRLWLKGGRKVQDCLIAEHRGTFWVKLEPQEVEFTSDYSDSTCTSSDSFSDEDGQEPGPGPPDSSFLGSIVGTNGADSNLSSAAPPAPLDAPGASGGASHHNTCPSSEALPAHVRQATAKWSFATSQDAFAQGKHGDTSGRGSCKGSHAVSRTTAKHRLTTKLGFCAKLGLFGMTFLAQIHALQAVKRPEDHLVHAAPSEEFRVCKNVQFCDYPNVPFPLDFAPDKSADVFHVGVLVTLLEEAKDDGFVIVCQFVSDIWDSRLAHDDHGSGPCILSLENAIPGTAFQAAVQELQDLLPERPFIRPDHWQDWLDCDLCEVHSACKACPAIWDWLSKFGTWYDAVFDPEALHVYTDGSAGQDVNGHASSVSWAFNVWAVTATKQAYLGHAFGTATQDGSSFHLGECAEDALTGEQLALAWAFCWVIEASSAFRGAVFIFHFDSQVAGYGGFGSFKLPSGAGSTQPTLLSRSVAVLRQCAQAVCTVVGRHVPSHSGYAGNELADVLAKYAGRHPVSDAQVSRPCWPSQVIKHEFAEWAWLAIRHQDDLPALSAFESEAHRLFVEAAARPFSFYAPEPSATAVTESVPSEVGIQLRLCTLNVLSMREHDSLPQGIAVFGKRALLKQQLLDGQLHVVAFQETRVPEDCVQPDADFIMLHSSCDSHGCLGCALWLSKTLPVVHSQQRSYCFTKEICTVLLSEPRALVVQVDLPGFPVTLVSAHAPYDGHKQLDSVHFWQRIAEAVSSRPSRAQLVVLTDSNGHLGSVSSTAVGTAGAEWENQAGLAFHDFLVSHGLFVPSTFPEYHQGRHFTWKVASPVGHRLDYVAVPEEWGACDLASSVWHDFDHAHDADDHQPTLLHCELLRKTADRFPDVPFRAPRPQADTDPGQLQCFQYALEALPKIGWHLDVDSHYAAFVRSTLWCWTEFVKHKPRRRCKPFISDETLEALDHRKQVRRFLVSEEAELRRVWLLVGFYAFWLQWQQVEPQVFQLQFLADSLRRGQRHTAAAIGCLGRLRLALRRAVRGDRSAYLKRLATDVAESSLQQPKQLYAAVYKAFPVVRSKRKGGFCPLPAVLLADGSRARDLQESVQRWTEHFAQQEGGVIVPASEYDQEVQPQAPNPVHVPAFDMHCVPTLLDIEQDMLRLRRGKASGPDMITADLLKLNVPDNSRRLLPVFTKAALACREPIVFKGGCLIALAKKAYASLNCADFRSIILSSVPGKLLHRSLRRKLISPLSEVALPLQAGALPGASPELLTLYLTAFQRWARSSKYNWAVIFFDVKQAYYRTLRQLVVDCDSDAGLCRVLHGLDLPAQAICELRDMLHKAATTSPLAGQQHLKAMLRDLLTATWFKFEASSMVAVTHKGTRPGDPAADVLFAFTLSALFRAIDSSLEAQGLVDVLPPVRCDPLLDGFEHTPRLQFVSWADDFARPFVGCTPANLLDKVRRTTQCCTERASACGVVLTFGNDKTATVCDVGTVQTEREHGTDMLSCGISFRDTVACRDCILPVVPAYKHLGGIFNATSKPDLEIFLRRASALGPLRPVRSKLFACRSVPLATRRTLLFSLGLSRFIHGAGALHLNQKGHQRAWHAAYISIWAHLVPGRAVGKPHSFQVLYVAKAPPPHLFLALQRAALLTKLMSQRFVAILHMLQLEWEVNPAESWLAQLVHDVSAVAQWVPAARSLQDSDWPIHELCTLALDCPSWWSTVIRKAVKAYAADIVKWKGMPRVVSVSNGGAFQCHICAASFSQRSFLFVHLARRHQLWAPARHFAHGRQCVACLKTFATVLLAQAHLRRSPSCLRRAVWLMEPMDLDAIIETEAVDKLASKKIKQGGWQQQRIVTRAQPGAGPQPVTAEDIDADPESFAIAVVARRFQPRESVLRWVEEYLSNATRAGPRQRAVCWWHAKPTEVNSV